MSITPQLRAVLAQREEEARRETARQLANDNEARRIERIMAAIDGAAPRLDAVDSGPNKWRPSQLLKIGYFVVATSETLGASRRAAELVHDRIHRQGSSHDA